MFSCLGKKKISIEGSLKNLLKPGILGYSWETSSVSKNKPGDIIEVIGVQYALSSV